MALIDLKKVTEFSVFEHIGYTYQNAAKMQTMVKCLLQHLSLSCLDSELYSWFAFVYLQNLLCQWRSKNNNCIPSKFTSSKNRCLFSSFTQNNEEFQANRVNS